MAEMTEEEFLAKLQSMSNESLAKLLLNKSLIHLVSLLNQDMATAADINVARAILKDNNIGIVPTRTNVAGQLKQKLEERAAQSQVAPNVIPLDELDSVDITDFMQRH